jgi:hypothetical protein
MVRARAKGKDNRRSFASLRMTSRTRTKATARATAKAKAKAKTKATTKTTAGPSLRSG